MSWLDTLAALRCRTFCRVWMELDVEQDRYFCSRHGQWMEPPVGG